MIRLPNFSGIFFFRFWGDTFYTSLRIIGPSYRGVWIRIAGFRDLQTPSFEIPCFLGLVKTSHNLLFGRRKLDFSKGSLAAARLQIQILDLVRLPPTSGTSLRCLALPLVGGRLMTWRDAFLVIIKLEGGPRSPVIRDY